jgi:hypothetical protein
MSNAASIALSMWLIIALIIGLVYVITVRTPRPLRTRNMTPAFDKKMLAMEISVGILGTIGLLAIVLASVYQWPRALDAIYWAFFLGPLLDAALAAQLAMTRLHRLGRVF